MKKAFFIFYFLVNVLMLIGREGLAETAVAPDLILIGNIPGEYIEPTGIQRVSKDKTYLGYVRIHNRLVVEIKSLNTKNFEQFIASAQASGAKQVILSKAAKSKSNEKISFTELQQNADVIYPGLINLHNHTKQNNLPVWDKAQGQFVNRFEWKDFNLYKKAVSFNINPWVNYGPAAECATYRWSEMQAMVGGTAYLQGPSTCVSSFGISRVEDAAAYISQKDRVSAPTDLIIPEEFAVVWSELRPLIKAGKTYEQALVQTIAKYCPPLKSTVTEQNINNEALKILSDQTMLKSACDTGQVLPAGFLRYISYSANHAAMAGRKKYLANPKRSAIIVHLAEGRHDDPYNQVEYEMFDLLGFTRPFIPSAKRQVPMVFVHGVGIPQEKFPELAEKGIGLVWSPFSNLLLYNQTLDVVAAKKAGVILSLGSDWLPTGTRHVLEELKFAKKYLQMQKLFQVPGGFDDEMLYKMVTENPAKQIDHFELKKEKEQVIEAPIGRLVVGAMGSVIAVKKSVENPYTNLVDATEKDININVIDGKPVYGNQSYIDQYSQTEYETLSVDSDEYGALKIQSMPKPPMDQINVKRVTSDPAVLTAHLVSLGRLIKEKTFGSKKICQFEEQKVFVRQSSLNTETDSTDYAEIIRFKMDTGLNLDRASDIAKILAVNILTQSRNDLEPDGDPQFALQNFSPLYSCNDEKHEAKIKYYFEQVLDKRNGEYFKNSTERERLRENQNLNGTRELYNLYK